MNISENKAWQKKKKGIETQPYFHYCLEYRFHIHFLNRRSQIRDFHIFAYSYIHRFTGLLQTNMIIILQLAC